MRKKKIKKEALKRKIEDTTQKQNKIQDSFNSKSYLSQNSARAKLITQNISEMIALDYQPYSIVEDRGFKNLMYTLESKYKLPKRQYLASTAIPRLYSKKLSLLKEEINTELNSMQSISFTFNIWISGAQQPYISLTTHYLTKQFELRNKTLGCSYFPGEHHGKSIFLKIKSMVSEWNMDILSLNIPIYMVTDNARNISCALNKYNSNDNLHHYFCAAHTLQLAIQDALKENNMESLLKKCRSIVTHYNYSNKSCERLQQIQVRLNLPNHKLIQMVETRWNSVFLMLERIIEQKEAIVLDLQNWVKDIDITVGEWKLINGYVEILKPVLEATKEFSQEDIPTFAMQYSTYLLATAIDPRFKTILMESYEVENVKRLLTTEVESFKLTSDTKLETTEQNIQPITVPVPTNSLWAILQERSISSTGNEGLTSCVKNEIQEYLHQPLLPPTSNPPCMVEN
ncbi:zinc finger BED domain-containing protein 4-like [Melanaphis sacchari]|uniref:zinc finger BED domain-containing protein 4-like n=1 Tax=Melanaphis sacchari TaxID=742174 RepID=UPI000DC14D2E|nr:zinc finger BED domain-containing protein 4-like [Melanaphis sacchari]